MNRRDVLLLGAGTAAAPWLALAQQRTPRIGYLLLTALQESPSRERGAFLDGLREHGRIAGRDVEIVYASAESHVEFLASACRDLLARKIDLMVTSGAESTLAARDATRTLPIVFLALGDPVGLGVVRSLARPAGNLTGVSFISSDLAAKRMQILREAAPGIKRVALLWDEGNRNAIIEVQAVRAAARSLAIQVEAVPLRDSAGVSGRLERLAARKPDGLYVAFAGGVVADNRSVIAAFGLRHRLPVISGWGFLTEAGGLLSYAPDIPSMFRRGAYYVDRILRGARPADLPVEQPTRIELVVNAATAKAIGIALPKELLLRADRVIT